MHVWQLQEAKTHFSELVKSAVAQPQSITVHGKATVVVISQQEYNRLTKTNVSLVEFLGNSPLKDIDLEIKRDKSPCRDLDI